MDEKDKFDIEIENFSNAFGEFKDKNIVLYGTGRMTATIIKGLKEFNIIGLCDREYRELGETIYGIPIIDKDEVEKKADLLIINTSGTYWNTIYARIKDWNVPIYYNNGLLAEEEKSSYENIAYWEKSVDNLINQIEQHDIISFDIFDTLLTRKVFHLVDVFKLIEAEINKEKSNYVNFVEYRKMASSFIVEPTLDEIYIKIAELSGYSINEVENWKKIEKQVDRNLLIRRDEIAEICIETMKKKKVYFVSDMYYSSLELQEILRDLGIEVEQKQILVSCEHKKSKNDGSLWMLYKQEIAKELNALHIGDNQNADINMAKVNGINTFYIMSTYQMLQNSSIKDIEPHIESMFSSLTTGILISKLFNNPFALNSTKGKIRFDNEETAGFSLVGCVMYTFFDWLTCKSKEDGVKQLLFFGRDGFLLIDIYNFFVNLFEIKDAPKVVYLEISRRAVGNASIRETKDIYEIAKLPYEGDFKTFLKERFGVESLYSEYDDVDVFKIQDNKVEFEKILNKFENDILTRSLLERNNYLAYMETLNLDKEFGIVDSKYYGTTQFYLGKLVDKKLTGYYMCACIQKENKYLERNIMHGCFQGNASIKTTETNVHKLEHFFDAFLTAPYGMLEYVENDGSMKYSKNMSNQINFDVRYDMLKGVFDFMREYKSIKYGIEDIKVDIMWADKLFGTFLNKGCIQSLKMKNSFYFDNKIINNREMPIWE